MWLGFLVINRREKFNLSRNHLLEATATVPLHNCVSTYFIYLIIVPTNPFIYLFIKIERDVYMI